MNTIVDTPANATPLELEAERLKLEREAIAREIANAIREDEVKYRQLLLDLEKAEHRGLEGYLYSEVNGTVMTVASPEDANSGDTLIEIVFLAENGGVSVTSISAFSSDAAADAFTLPADYQKVETIL